MWTSLTDKDLWDFLDFRGPGIPGQEHNTQFRETILRNKHRSSNAVTTGTGEIDRQAGTSKLIQPPTDPLLAAIPLDVRDDWRGNPTPELIRRLEFLCACGPRPSDDLKAMGKKGTCYFFSGLWVYLASVRRLPLPYFHLSLRPLRSLR